MTGVSLPAPPRGGWRALVEQSWPAVIAVDLLRGSEQVWQAEGLGAPVQDEAVALALVGRLVRYGQSVQIKLPISREPTLPRLAFYLHRLRLDAAQGLLRSPWLNRVTIASRNDLIVFGRPRAMLRDFSTSTVMRPTVVGAGRPLPSSEAHRTLLADGHDNPLEVLEHLKQKSRPFAIVVQATPQGCGDYTVNLLKVLPDFFPDVPIVVLAYTGQILAEPLALHTWSSRLTDALGWDNAPRSATPLTSPAVEVMAARDPTMDAFVKKLGYLVWTLKRLMEQTGGISPEMSALLAADRALRCLNVPLKVHEERTMRHVRGGRYPIRTIASWVEIASRLKGRRGDVQALLEEVILLVRNMMRDLAGAKPGRGEAIVHLCHKALISNQRITVLVGGRRDADILQNHLELQLGPEAIGRVTVLQMDGASAVPPERADVVLYAGVLYTSRIHWLGLLARRKIVLCHPFERERVCQQVENWMKSHALPSAPHGDKQRLWALQWPQQGQGFLRDLLVHEPALAATVASSAVLDVDGDYPKAMRIVQLEASRGFDDWLQALMTEPTLVQRDIELASEPTRDVVVLHLDAHSEPLRWPVGRRIMRLDGDDLVECAVQEVQVGHELIMLVTSEDRVATQHDLFEMFVQNHHGLAQTVRIAEKWQDFVDGAMRKCDSVAELHRYLKSKRFEVHTSTVQNWALHGVIGPQNPAAIRLLAEHAEVPGAEKLAKMVEQAIQAVRGEHRRIGADLRRAIAASRLRDVSGIQIGTRRFSREVFDAMVQVSRVLRVERPGQAAGTPQQARCIKDVAMDFAMQHPSKVYFTPACERVMNKSVYADLTAFKKVLQVLTDGFYPMYATKSKSLKEVETMLAPIPASYAGSMSDVTKGRFESDYFKVYKNKKVDIGRHIKLGRAFDPRFTCRLYFHWDDDDAKIVVHHAGEHLPTANQ